MAVLWFWEDGEMTGTAVSDYEALQAQRTARLEAGRPLLEEIAGTPLQVIDGGYRVKETGTHYIDVLEMFFNWRVVTTPKSCELVWDRGWCYQGTGLAGFLPAVLAALAWDGDGSTEPPGYFKRAGA
jgi:hypothetical protein